MKANSTQQEILIMTGTNFSHRQWSEKEDTANNNLSDKEQLEQACWNGLLQEMLPELCEKPGKNKKLWLWQIKEATSFLELELGEFPETKDNYFSIDPYSFLSTKSYN